MENQEGIKIKEFLEEKGIEEILVKIVKKSGTGGSVSIPKRHLGKEVIVIVKKSKKVDK